jgi:hypothetical protein
MIPLDEGRLDFISESTRFLHVGRGFAQYGLPELETPVRQRHNGYSASFANICNDRSATLDISILDLNFGLFAGVADAR